MSKSLDARVRCWLLAVVFSLDIIRRGQPSTSQAQGVRVIVQAGWPVSLSVPTRSFFTIQGCSVRSRDPGLTNERAAGAGSDQ